MTNYIIETYSNVVPSDFSTIILNNVIAIALSVYILFIYRVTYKGTAYSKKFAISLGMITVITSLIMNVISNNIALSLGMVGALSIIRFRTAVKDVRDATYIFWCISIGICSGVSQYLPAVIGSISVSIFLLVMGQTTKDGKYLIIIRSSGDVQNKVEAAVDQYFEKSAQLKVRNATNESGDLIYEVSKRAIDKAYNKFKSSIVEKTLKIEGVSSVEQIEQNDDISK